MGKAYARIVSFVIFVYRSRHRHGSTSNCVRVERTGLTRGVSGMQAAKRNELS